MDDFKPDIRRFVPLFALCIFAAHAAETVQQPDAPDETTILQGQTKFLNASMAMCRERVPSMKRELDDAYDHAEAEIRKAESAIRKETAATIKQDQRYLDLYTAAWSKSADQLIESIEEAERPPGVSDAGQQLAGAGRRHHRRGLGQLPRSQQ